jgi:GT2 family glycosyltransferase
VVPTGATLERRLTDSDIPHLAIGENPGFAATIRLGAEGDDWQWLLVVNDDVDVDVERLAPLIGSLGDRDAQANAIVYLDPVPPRRVPTVADALGGLSLLGPALARVRPAPGPVASRSGAYRPFSFVAVSRPLWATLGGLDTEFVYTFEDADFARRAEAAGAEVSFPEDTGVRHDRYGTSSRRIAAVLPCAAWSTAVYLERLGLPRPASRGACMAALVARLPLVLASDLPAGQHVRGIGGALWALVSGRRPTLPAYWAN